MLTAPPAAATSMRQRGRAQNNHNTESVFVDVAVRFFLTVQKTVTNLMLSAHKGTIAAGAMLRLVSDKSDSEFSR